MQVKFEMVQDVTTGERTLYAFGDGALHRIGVIPCTKWKAVSGMQSAIVDLCQRRTDWESVKVACQSMIDAAPSVPPGDISAQVFDQLKLLRAGSPLGDLLKKAADGEFNANEFLAAAAREEMIRAFASHIIRFTSVIGEGLGTGILLILPNGACAVLTCSHVWEHLGEHQQIQMLCAATPDSVILNQKMIQVAVDDLCALDMSDRDFMDRAGVDALLFKRDSAIIAGSIRGLLPIGARAFDLRGVARLEPQAE